MSNYSDPGMPETIKKAELLAPAGNFEKLEIAIHYGTDAVYLGGRNFSLRNFSENFTDKELQEAVEFAHRHGVKVYAACNVFPRNYEHRAITDYLEKLGEIGPDSIIVADPGIFAQASQLIPHIPLHLSTQANTTNSRSALFWEKLGAKRINAARELSLEEIKETASCCTSLEIEAFVHGAMCISYSGRCLLSSFMAGRESNRGMCCHPCRFKYMVMEEKRPGKYYPFAEDEKGSYIFNSKDLCMIEHIPEIIKSGITSLKIEGRMKSISYLASAVRVYREAIDSWYSDPGKYEVKEEWIEELAKISDRGYCTGFYFGDPDQVVPKYSKNEYAYESVFAGKVLERAGSGKVLAEVRNKIFKGDIVEVLTKTGPAKTGTVDDIIDEYGESLPFAQPNARVFIALNTECSPNDVIRRVFSNELSISEYYRQNYEQYHERTFGIDMSSVLLPFTEKLAHGSRILDVGCGSGRDLLWLKKQGFHVTGFERCSGLAKLAGKNAKCKVIEGDFEVYDFSRFSVHGIVLTGSLVHVPHDRFENVFKRISSALLKGRGHLFVSLKQGTGKTDSHGRVFYLWEDEDLRKIFDKAGFNVLDYSQQKSLAGTDEIWGAYVLEKNS
ncbi:MAG: methyltransferase domain-containing protein [Desulfobacterales bacterium]|nr:methyltransferase domain-containing protein [Desulfobacterales bacterium]